MKSRIYPLKNEFAIVESLANGYAATAKCVACSTLTIVVPWDLYSGAPFVFEQHKSRPSINPQEYGVMSPHVIKYEVF